MRMVKPEASDGEIIAALEAACAWEFVQKLEDGLNTQVRERGTRFSEGQKQRLSIARALLADAPVMILDEATSAWMWLRSAGYCGGSSARNPTGR